MASKHTDDSAESVVHDFADVIKIATEVDESASEDDRLSYYTAHDAGSDCSDDQYSGEEGQAWQELKYAQTTSTASKRRSLKYDKAWDKSSNVGGTLLKETTKEIKEISERQAIQFQQSSSILSHTCANDHSEAVHRLDPAHCGKRELHLHLTQTFVNNPSAVTIGGNVNVSPACRDDEQSKAVIPSDKQILRCETEKKFEEWTEGMVVTEATQAITDMILQGRTWVTVTGGPGEGKTTSAYMALRSLHNLGRPVYDILCPEDYFKVKGSIWPVLMLNDIFGESHFDVCNLEKWRTVFNDILAMKEHRGVMETKDGPSVKAGTIRVERNLTLKKRKFQPSVILVSRSCVLASASQHLGRFKDLIYEADVMIDLTGDKKGSPEERMRIWKYHADRFNINMDMEIVREVCSMTLPYGFPHCCKLFACMFSKNTNLCMKTFFEKPLEFLNQSMESYMSDPTVGQLLREMLQHDGALRLDSISESERHYQFTTAVNQLRGVLLLQNGDLVKFLHPSIYDSVSFVMCRGHPMFVVTKCTLSFLNDRVRFSGLQGKDISDIELTVTIDKKYIEEFIKRLKHEIECNNVSLSLSHDSFNDEECVTNFMDSILPPQESQARSESAREMIHRRDTDARKSFLFLSSISKSDKLLRYICKFVDLSHEEQVDAVFGICEHTSVTSMQYFLFKFESVDLNIRNAESQTPLLVCSTKGSEEMIKLLLKRHVDVSATDQDGNSALHHICDVGVDGDGTVVKMLIERGSSANTESQIYPFVPLHLACVRGHVNVVRALLDKGTDVNVTDLMGDTPLHASSIEGHAGVVTALLEGGAALKTQNTWGDTPLYLASSLGHTKVVTTLLDNGADANLKNPSDDTPLCAASAEGNIGVVQALLGGGADINMEGPVGDTALYVACIRGFSKIVKLLLDHGAHVNVITKSGDTLLCVSCARSHTNVVRALLDNGAAISQRGRFGETALCAACAGGNVNVVMALLAQKANTNQADKMGNTPLHIACTQGHTDVVKILLERGADTSLRDARGNTPIEIANDRKHNSIATVLQTRSSSIYYKNHTELNSIFLVHKLNTSKWFLMSKPGCLLSFIVSLETMKSPVVEYKVSSHT